MGENATLTKIVNSDIKIVNNSTLKESVSLKKDNAPWNMLLKERYKMIPEEVRKYLKGFYGRPPAPIDLKIIEKAKIKKSEIIKCRPADLLKPAIEKAKKETSYLAENMEDILSYILFPEVARDFLKKKIAKKHNLGMEILNGNNNYDEEEYGA